MEEWRKSRASGTGNCVEVANVGTHILVRDSKYQDGPQLSFTQSEWVAFLAGVRNNEFEL